MLQGLTSIIVGALILMVVIVVFLVVALLVATMFVLNLSIIGLGHGDIINLIMLLLSGFILYYISSKLN